MNHLRRRPVVKQQRPPRGWRRRPGRATSLDVAQRLEADTPGELLADRLNPQDARLLQVDDIQPDLDERRNDGVHPATRVHPHVPALLVGGIKDARVARLKERAPHPRADERSHLRAPVVGEGEPVDASRETRADLADHGDVEGDDAVGQLLHASPVGVELGEHVGHPTQRVHALKKQHKDTGGDVLALGTGKAFLHARVVGGIIGIGPAVARIGAPVLQGVPLDLAHVGHGAAHPPAAPLVVRLALGVVAGADGVRGHGMRIADAQRRKSHRQAVGRLEMDRPLDDLVG